MPFHIGEILKYIDELNRLVKKHPNAKLIQRINRKDSKEGFAELLLLPVAGFHYKTTGDFVEGDEPVNAVIIN